MPDGYLQEMRLQLSVLVFLLPTRLLLRSSLASQAIDVSDRAVKEVGLKNGLVDVKVCAIDDSWSVLKFARRLKDRDDNLRPKNRKV